MEAAGRLEAAHWGRPDGDPRLRRMVRADSVQPTQVNERGRPLQGLGDGLEQALRYRVGRHFDVASSGPADGADEG
jgi:hypothetical protein